MVQVSLLDSSGETLVPLRIIVLQGNLKFYSLRELSCFVSGTLENSFHVLAKLISLQFTVIISSKK